MFLFSLGKYQEVELLDRLVALFFFFFFGTAILFFTEAAPLYIPTHSGRAPLSSAFLPLVSCLFSDSHSDYQNDVRV